ncbi:MAG: hydrolase family protein [Solirubrobacterales bacterium]|nr:hydrolase family protein [Solirubrobacterales bacterium]
MKAMNGSGGLGARRVLRLLGCAAALAALAAMTMTSVASARKAKPVSRTYVALGDSLAFGYSQQLFNENFPAESPAAFENGYANEYLADTNEASRKPYQMVNYGCPGETTESLIGDNPTFIKELNEKARKSISEPITGEAPCAYHYEDGLPLHNEYGAGESQLETTLKTIKKEKEAGTPVKVLSLDIGANDELHEVAKATKEAEAEVEAKVGAIVTPEAEKEVEEKVNAIAAGEVEAYVVEQVIPQAFGESGGAPPTFEEDIAKDAAAYGAAHASELHLHGIQDALKYVAGHLAELNAEGHKIGLELAGKYAAEHGAELKKEGEELGLGLIKAALPTEFAQIDTNVVGILNAIKMDGFKGKIIFVGTYDPYGRVGGINKEHKELEPGFNAAAAALAGLEQGTFAANPHLKAVCYSNSETTFNVALSVTEKANPSEYSPAELTLIGEEESKLDAYTNMANFTVTGGKTYGSSGADGPDIHATPTGYKVMAKQMEETCSF